MSRAFDLAGYSPRYVHATAMLLPEAPDELDRPWRYVITGILFRWGLIIVAVLVMLQSAVNRNVRHYLRTHQQEV